MDVFSATIFREGKRRFPKDALINLEKRWWRGGKVKQESSIWINFTAIHMYLAVSMGLERKP